MNNCKLSELCSRRQFLKNVSFLSMALASLSLASPLLVSCSSKFDSNNDNDSSVSSSETGITYNKTTKKLTIPKTSTKGTALGTSGALQTISTVDSTTLNVLMVNDAGTVKAFTSVCPHAGTTNQWSFNSGIVTCADHNSQFNSSNGSKSSGPATNNLTTYSVDESDPTSYVVQLT